MSVRGPDIILGRAVDDPTTKKYHQIFNVIQSSKDDFYTLQYCVCTPVLKKDPGDVLPDNFISLLNEKNLDDKAVLQYATRQFSILMSNIRKDMPKSRSFILNEGIECLNYRFKCNKSDHEIQDFRIDPVLGVMTENIYNKDAAQKIITEPQDEELRLWHDFAHANMKRMFDEGHDKENISFSQVTQTTSDIIKMKLYEFTVENKVDCIYRASPFEKPVLNKDFPMPRKNHKACFYQYGNTLDTEKDIQPIHDLMSKNVISATASRESIDAYNMVVLYEAIKHQVSNPFPTGTSQVIASLKDTLSAVKRKRVLQL